MSTTREAATGTPPQEQDRTPRLLRIAPELIVLALCAALFATTGDMTTSAAGPGPAFYPRLLIALLAVAMVVRIAHQLRSNRRMAAGLPAEVAGGEPSDFDPATISDRRVLGAVAAAVAYVFLTIYLGWPLATFLFVVGFLWVSGKRNLVVTVPVGLAVTVAFTFVFVKVVYMSLPTGVGIFDSFTVTTYKLLGIY